MTTVSTELTLPCTADRAILAIQDTIDRSSWKVLEMSTSRIVLDTGPINAMHMYNFPKMTLSINEKMLETDISVSVSWVNPGAIGAKKRLVGIMGTFVNSVSLRVQTNSIAINPTVAIGEGQGGPSSSGSDRLTQLSQLQSLRQSGALTEDEFESEKKRILGQP